MSYKLKQILINIIIICFYIKVSVQPKNEFAISIAENPDDLTPHPPSQINF
jgi:hypothetical protein